MIVSFFEYLIPFIVLLSILVFIHELGHFLVARYYGVRVEVFSLGFGPKIFKYKKGDTVYCISLIPLGGYVKMFGDDPRQSVPKHQRKKAFLCQKVGPKMAIAFAGPFMNFIMAILLFSAIAMIGQHKALPELGDIQADSIAYKVGFRAKDKIVSINEHKISYWEDVEKWIKKNPDKKLVFNIQRSNSHQQVEVKTQAVPSQNLTSLNKIEGRIKGLTIFSKSSHIGVSDHHSLAYQSGLRVFDEIVQLNDQKILNWEDLNRFFNSNLPSVLKIKVKRENTKEPVSLDIPISSLSIVNLTTLGIEKPDLYIGRVKPSSPAEKAGLMEKDRLLSINGKKLNHWSEFSDVIEKDKSDSKIFHLTVLRKGVEKKIDIQAEKMPLFNPDGSMKHRYMIGVASAQFVSYPELVFSRMINPVRALNYGVKETVKWIAITGKIIGRLITGSISRRMIGGPLSIAKVAKQSFFASLIHFLRVMAIVSVNLCLMNLLPIPILDGGHLMLFTIEGIKGKPLSVKKIEIIQTVGLVLIIFLVVFTLFNDVQNWNVIW